MLGPVPILHSDLPCDRPSRHMHPAVARQCVRDPRPRPSGWSHPAP